MAQENALAALRALVDAIDLWAMNERNAMARKRLGEARTEAFKFLTANEPEIPPYGRDGVRLAVGDIVDVIDNRDGQVVAEEVMLSEVNMTSAPVWDAEAKAMRMKRAWYATWDGAGYQVPLVCCSRRGDKVGGKA